MFNKTHKAQKVIVPQPSQQVGQQGHGDDGEHVGGEMAEATSAPSKASPPSLERAKEQYAHVHGMDPSAVTEELLAKSDEGVEGVGLSRPRLQSTWAVGERLVQGISQKPNHGQNIPLVVRRPQGQVQADLGNVKKF